MAARLSHPRLALALATSTALLVGCAHFDRLDFVSTGRDMWQRPEDVVQRLGLEPGSTVADLGADEGYFVSHLADAVGDEGRVYAVEVDDDRAEDLYARFVLDSNVEVVRGTYDEPDLPDGEIDLVLLVNALHRIDDHEAYFRRLQAFLSPGGRVAVIEPDAQLSGLLALFVDDDRASARWQVEVEMAHAGYRTAASHEDLLPIQIFEVYTPTAENVASGAP